VTHHTLIREEMRHFFDSFPHDAHPMAVLASGTVGMSTFYPDAHEIFDADAVEITINRLIAKLPTLAAWSFKKAIGQPYMYPRNDLGYAANLLHMMFAVPSEEYEVDPKVAEALDLLLILHADHEQNCSTSTVRMVGSHHANLYASISAGISALWGPLHGGANEAVINTLERIVADGGTAREVGRQGEGSRRHVPPRRLRSPRLQELRPAREDHQGGRERVLPPPAPTTSCSRSPSGSRRSRSTTSTSSAASSTRTSTSTPA
jgi:citrate synthase